MTNKKNITPLLMLFVLLLGILLGFRISDKYSFAFQNKDEKIDIKSLIKYINENYVDSVDTDDLHTKAINGMLSSLDPHSIYIPAEDFNNTNAELLGNFEGIGIQFRIEHDTVMVISTIVGGPSEKSGLLAGDRIVEVDKENIASVGIDNEKAMKLLKGPKNTVVNVGIVRLGVSGILYFDITRDVIPTWSIDVAFKVNDSTGYIKISKFSATTDDELKFALSDFKSEGIYKLILDLRGNAGGYLEEAIAVSDEFLPADKLIVYTKGLHRSQKEAYSTSVGLWDDLPVVVLTDEGSASASEIVAGAIQDNDRGFIIGRRTFGKGLVQEQISFKDGSAMRLTTSKYYTPTGRCIQKPYDKGSEDYYMELMERYADKETSDTTKNNTDTVKYITPMGRVLYGGGGITPDIIVPAETVGDYTFYAKCLRKGTIFKFAFEYTDKNRKALNNYSDFDDFNAKFHINNDIFGSFIAFASKDKIKATEKEIAFSKQKISDLLKAYIARNVYDDEGFYPIYLKTDSTYLKALQILNSNATLQK
ncbi:MAG: S41 family peptidase [Lentimicrobiaceae bacterium]|nr:S41 family peptidase [Lentimicrobiaceae bacterium]